MSAFLGQSRGTYNLISLTHGCSRRGQERWYVEENGRNGNEDDNDNIGCPAYGRGKPEVAALR